MPKRKRDEANDPISFRVAETQSEGIGPVIVNFPSIDAPNDTSFKCYASKTSKLRDQVADAQDDDYSNMLVVGETCAVEFVTNTEETKRMAQNGCRYVLAVHNKKTSSVTIVPKSISPHILYRQVKALKSITPSPAPSALEWQAARTNLGETFGTKKAKAAIRARERNQVDVGAMKDVMDYVMDGIDKAAVNLPTQNEAKDAQDANRLIPPFDSVTDDPAEIYRLHDVIPDPEWKSIPVGPLEIAASDGERTSLLPYRGSKWIRVNFHPKLPEDKKQKKRRLQTLYYISAMFAFRRFTERTLRFEKEQIQKAMDGVPSLIIDGLLSRFTEVSRGAAVYQCTTTMQTKLMSYLLALCLRVDNFATDYTILAHDLNLPVQKLKQQFLNLGCKMKKMTSERERVKLGLSDQYAEMQMAVLTAPVEFPKQKFQRRAKR